MSVMPPPHLKQAEKALQQSMKIKDIKCLLAIMKMTIKTEVPTKFPNAKWVLTWEVLQIWGMLEEADSTI